MQTSLRKVAQPQYLSVNIDFTSGKYSFSLLLYSEASAVRKVLHVVNTLLSVFKNTYVVGLDTLC